MKRDRGCGICGSAEPLVLVIALRSTNAWSRKRIYYSKIESADDVDLCVVGQAIPVGVEKDRFIMDNHVLNGLDDLAYY